MSNFVNLLDYRSDKYSSTGNDGIIEHIFKKLNIKKGVFIEFGAWDGIKYSNCRKLFEEGWSGIFIESDKRRYRKLEKNYKDCENIKCINKKVEHKGSNIFDDIVDPHLNGKNIDFCSIDIDGLDVEVFETFKKYLPTVICIESGIMLHPFHERVSYKVAKKRIQQSLNVTVNVFKKRGYKILCFFWRDCFFIKEEFYHLFNVSSDLLTLYFDGLRTVPDRIPKIQSCMDNVGLRNKIADYILKKSNYNGWKRRRKWFKKQKDLIFMLINKAEKMERKNMKF